MKSFSLVPTPKVLGASSRSPGACALAMVHRAESMISKKRSVLRIAGRERDARAEPFLSGMFTRGEVVFAGSETEAAHDREPVAIFTGEVLPHYAGGAKVGLGA